jgi:hypothetical protein
MCLANLGRLLCDLGEIREAEILFDRAIAAGNKVLGVEHPQTQRYQSQYARLLLRTNHAARALALGELALATHARFNRPAHPWTKDSAAVTAGAFDALGRTDEASALRERYEI